MFASLHYDVYCHMCGNCYQEEDPAVRFTGSVWECADESACRGRRAGGAR